MKARTVLFQDYFVPSPFGFDICQRLQISPVKNPGRNQRPVRIKAQQPKTKPDDAFDILGCCETLRDNENVSMRLATQGRLLRRGYDGSRVGVLTTYA